jgi:hypothetical protein
VVEATISSIRSAMEQLERCTEHVKAMLDGTEGKDGAEYDARLASHLSWLTRNMTGCLDAMRKQEAAERARWKSMGVAEEADLVRVWLDEAPEEQRAEIRAHLDELGAGGGLLS